MTQAGGDEGRNEKACAGTKRALPKAIVTSPPAKRAEDMEEPFLNVEEFMKKCPMLVGKQLGEYLGATVAIDLCAKFRKPGWSWPQKT